MQIILVIMHLRLCQICYHVCAYYSIIHSLTVVPEAISKQVNWNKSPCVVLIQEQCNRKTSPVCHQGNTNLQFSKQFSFEQHGCVWMGFSSVSLCSIATVMKRVIGGLIEGGAGRKCQDIILRCPSTTLMSTYINLHLLLHCLPFKQTFTSFTSAAAVIHLFITSAHRTLTWSTNNQSKGRTKQQCDLIVHPLDPHGS